MYNLRTLPPHQVLEWLDNHGQVFLDKHTSIGRSLARSKTLQKNHEHFEQVGQVGALTPASSSTYLCLSCPVQSTPATVWT